MTDAPREVAGGAPGPDGSGPPAEAQPAQWCRLHLSDRAALPLAGGVVGDAALVLGLGLDDAARLRALTQELCLSVAAEGFPDESVLDIDVALERRAGAVAVVVTDAGAPSHLTRPGAQPPRLTELVRLGFADELSFAALGRQGNRAELVKRLHYANVRAELDEAGEAPVEEVPDDVAERIAYRPLEPEDTLEVARLFHRCYGFTAYYAEEMYEPDRLAELVRAGLHIGTVATVDDRLIGHVSSSVDRPDAKVGVIGELVVDPAYRRFHIAGQLTLQHGMRLLAQGMIGQYSACVTVHPASQKIALKYGGHEVGVLLAAQLPSLSFRDIDDETRGRKAVVWVYAGAGQEPERSVHVPPHYRERVETIYQNANLPRVLVDPGARTPADAPERSELDLQLKAEARTGLVRVVTYGRDFISAVQNQVRELCLHRFDVIRLHLPLADPGTAAYGSGLRELGFSFCGVFPEFLPDGDALVLQYLNDQQVDPDEIQTASDFGAQLLQDVLADYRSTLRLGEERQRSRARLARIYESLS
ncbi:MAG: GNAT family N-acetyltransferase [Candidatus Nanopelagicales bacterium]